MDPADVPVPKRVFRDSGANSDLASPSQTSRAWTTAQILTPILVAFFLCLAFILYILYKRGSLPGLVPTLPFMRSVRRVRRHRQWEVDGEGGDLPHAPDAEATPMISQPHPWNSFFPRNATDRQHPNSRIKEGMVAPALATAIRSIQRLFGRGPIAVSRVPVPDTFDLESSDSETDPFDTLRSNASRAKLNPSANSKHNVASGSDRGASSYTLSHRSDGTRESSALDAEFDDDPGFDLGVVNGVGGGNDADDHESAVILIGQDYSSSGGTLSLRGGRSAVEADQSSLEVVPPTPTLDRRPFHASAYHVRSASTPHIRSPFSDSPQTHPFSPSTGDLSSGDAPKPHRLHPTSPLPVQSASGGPSRPSGNVPAPRAHYYTEAAPPTDPESPHSPGTVSALTIPHTSSYQRTHHSRGSYSPPVSPHLQNYMPTFPGRSPPGSPYALPGSVPSSPIGASNLQNLIPPAVRGAGYNPFGRSASDLG